MLLMVEQSCCMGCMGCMGIWSWCMFMAGIGMAMGMATRMFICKGPICCCCSCCCWTCWCIC